ncbi:hypothetical protein B0H14DRAFT_2891637 [Mycena olivaceomarginata]|nr:hypothetical protein B0H14DRAFT_2891637 [Mycena olivaceomarginata]
MSTTQRLLNAYLASLLASTSGIYADSIMQRQESSSYPITKCQNDSIKFAWATEGGSDSWMTQCPKIYSCTQDGLSPDANLPPDDNGLARYWRLGSKYCSC